MLLAAAPRVQNGTDLGPCVGCVTSPLQRLQAPRGLPSTVAQRELLQKVKGGCIHQNMPAAAGTRQAALALL